MATNSKVDSYIGLSQRSGSIIYGEDIIMEKVRLIKVVLISTGAPDKYKERLKRKLDGIVDVFEYEITSALHRDNVNAIAITNEGLATAIKTILR